MLSQFFAVWLRNGAVVRQRRIVQQLAGAPGAQLHETLERHEVAHVGDAAHVPLDVSGHIRAQPIGRLQAVVEDARVAAGEQRLVQGCRVGVEARHLAARHRQQVLHGGAAGEGLAYEFKQRQVLRTREYPTARCRVVVHHALQIGEQGRYAMHFVDDGPGVELGKERARILLRERPHVQRFQGQIAVFREEGAAQRGLAALPRAGERHDRKALRRLPDVRGQVAIDDHAPRMAQKEANSKLEFRLA